MIRVLIVDDHPIFRRGLADLVTAAGGMEVVREVDDGLRALNVANEVEWDIAILDVSLPRLNGVELLRRLVVAYPNRKIIMLSQFSENEFGARVVNEGAAGFVSKSGPPEFVVEAIRELAAGRPMPVPPSASDLIPTGQPARMPHQSLTPREYQVFTLIASGRTVALAAAELNVASSTVSNHLFHIKEKLGVSSVPAIVAYAHRVGLVE